MKKNVVTVIPGDGIGPECVKATQHILEAAGAAIEWEECQAGAEVFKKGIASGVPKETIDSITKNKVVLKGPLETPVGYGEKSANVTLRKLFETYGNIRPAKELPGIKTPYSGRGIDLVVVRENVEDLYAGIEHMQSPNVAQCLKLISRKGCEKIVKLGFELARAEGRKNVACATKSNIMKLTEGMLKSTFESLAKEYSDLDAWHIIIDNCAHQLVKKPEQFEVIITTNMNGDIISDLSSALIGGLGFAPSANIGNEISIFEAVHGSAPKYAGKNVINPTAVLLSAVMMLRQFGDFEIAQRIENALFVTLEAGVYTRDVREEGSVSTTTFTNTIIGNLGKESENWKVRKHKAIKLPQVSKDPATIIAKERSIFGADIFIESRLQPDELGPKLEKLAENTKLKLKMISNRGTKVYPSNGAITDIVDDHRCRFITRKEPSSLSRSDVMELLAKINLELEWHHLELLQEIDNKRGFTLAQGED